MRAPRAHSKLLFRRLVLVSRDEIPHHRAALLSDRSGRKILSHFFEILTVSRWLRKKPCLPDCNGRTLTRHVRIGVHRIVCAKANFASSVHHSTGCSDPLHITLHFHFRPSSLSTSWLHSSFSSLGSFRFTIFGESCELFPVVFQYSKRLQLLALFLHGHIVRQFDRVCVPCWLF